MSLDGPQPIYIATIVTKLTEFVLVMLISISSENFRQNNLGPCDSAEEPRL